MGDQGGATAQTVKRGWPPQIETFDPARRDTVLDPTGLHRDLRTLYYQHTWRFGCASLPVSVLSTRLLKSARELKAVNQSIEEMHEERSDPGDTQAASRAWRRFVQAPRRCRFATPPTASDPAIAGGVYNGPVAVPEGSRVVLAIVEKDGIVCGPHRLDIADTPVSRPGDRTAPATWTLADLADAGLLRHALYAVWSAAETRDITDRWLHTKHGGDYWPQREALDAVRCYPSTRDVDHWRTDAGAARLVAGAVANDHV